MQFSVCLMLTLVAAAAAAPAYPKKYDPLIHGPKRTPIHKELKEKFQEPLKTTPEVNSYDGFEGAFEVPLQPPAEYPYFRADGQAHGDISPPPSSDDTSSTTSSYLVYDKEGEMLPFVPPPVSSYAIIPASNDGADAMSFLRFLVRALPKDSSYSKYSADPEPEDLNPPDQHPESSYLAYGDAIKADTIMAPSTEHKKEKTVSSYSSYE